MLVAQQCKAHVLINYTLKLICFSELSIEVNWIVWQILNKSTTILKENIVLKVSKNYCICLLQIEFFLFLGNKIDFNEVVFLVVLE